MMKETGSKWISFRCRCERWIADYLTYSRSELRGFAILATILTILVTVKTILPRPAPVPLTASTTFLAEVGLFQDQLERARENEKSAGTKRPWMERESKNSIFPGDSGRLIVRNIEKGKAAAVHWIIDLNSADTFDLQRLKGIGPAFARRIVSYRERLRGFSDKAQLLGIFGMDSARYSEISDHVTVNRDSIHPYDINRVTFKELLRHPCFPFELTKRIMIFRQKSKWVSSVEELRKIDGMTDSLFRRISVYLAVIP